MEANPHFLVKVISLISFLSLTTPFQLNGTRRADLTGLLTTIKDAVATGFQWSINEQRPIGSLCGRYPADVPVWALRLLTHARTHARTRPDTVRDVSACSGMNA